MESIDTYNNSEAQAEGKKLAEGNPFFRDLASLMENEAFREFFNKYMNILKMLEEKLSESEDINSDNVEDYIKMLGEDEDDPEIS